MRGVGSGFGELTWRGVHCGDTGEEIPGEAVAACRGGGVGPVAGDHVVDCSHVDTVLGEVSVYVACGAFNGVVWKMRGTYVRYGDEKRENHWGDPVHVRRPQARPGKAEEADCFEWGNWEQLCQWCLEVSDEIGAAHSIRASRAEPLAVGHLGPSRVSACAYG